MHTYQVSTPSNNIATGTKYILVVRHKATKTSRNRPVAQRKKIIKRGVGKGSSDCLKSPPHTLRLAGRNPLPT